MRRRDFLILTASLAPPGGNLTGVSLMQAELMPKRVELLLEVVPRAKAKAGVHRFRARGFAAPRNDRHPRSPNLPTGRGQNVYVGVDIVVIR
jgi:hypothetical protein